LISADYNGWWQRSIGLVKASWLPLLVLQAIGAAVGFVLRSPAAIFQALATRDIREAAATRTSGLNFGNLFAGLGLSVVAIFIAFLVSALVTLAAVHVVAAAATGRQASVGDALRGAVRRLLPLIGWQLLAGLIVVAGICACILPGLYFAAVFMVLPAVVAFERSNAISRCFRLFHGNIGASVARVATILGVIIVASLVGGVIGGGISAIVAPAATATSGALIAGQLLTTVIGVIVAAAIGILTAPMIVTAYADMRARIEPVSTSVLVQELNAP